MLRISLAALLVAATVQAYSEIKNAHPTEALKAAEDDAEKGPITEGVIDAKENVFTEDQEVEESEDSESDYGPEDDSDDSEEEDSDEEEESEDVDEPIVEEHVAEVH